MTTAGPDNLMKYFATDNATVAHPTLVQPIRPIVAGTVGRSGVIEYSKAKPAVVNETYVVTKK